jgi:MFS family permease
MSGFSERARAGAARLRIDWLAWTLALVTGIDYFDNAAFSFFANDIAGGINASPSELVWAASAYSAAAVIGILQQQWWVDRLGHRRYIAGSMLMFALGACAAALADNSLELALARGFEGYFVGPMMGACRILIQIRFKPAERVHATRAFMTLILFGSALAPLIGSHLIAHSNWRALFACVVPPAIVAAGFALRNLPDSGDTPPEERTGLHFWPYLIFALAQGTLQIAMQQAQFVVIDRSPELALLVVAGLAACAWFGYNQWYHPAPMVRLDALRKPAFQVGLLLYMFYYYESTGYSFLISRFLEGGLGYPVEEAGWLVGGTSMLSGLTLFAYLRYAKKITHKKWVIVPGFGLAIVAALRMAHMSPDAGPAQLFVPLFLRGLLLIFIVLPVANLTFRVFEIDEYTHGYRLKNIMRQMTISFASASLIILQQHRLAQHTSRLSEALNPYNPVFQDAYQRLTQAFAAGGQTLASARVLALVELSHSVERQATFLAAIDGFYFLACVALLGGVFAAWQKQID